MKYCSKCGKEIYDETVICPFCGVQVKEPDRSSKGFAVLGFLFPVIGLILYLVNHNSYPKKAASAGAGALCGVLIPLIIGLVFFLIMLFSTLFSYSSISSINESMKLIQ